MKDYMVIIVTKHLVKVEYTKLIPSRIRISEYLVENRNIYGPRNIVEKKYIEKLKISKKEDT